MFIVNNYKTYSNNQLPLIKHMNYNLIFCELGFQAPFLFTIWGFNCCSESDHF